MGGVVHLDGHHTIERQRDISKWFYLLHHLPLTLLVDDIFVIYGAFMIFGEKIAADTLFVVETFALKTKVRLWVINARTSC